MIEFDEIKARISKYSQGSLLKACLFILRATDIDQTRNYPYWEILVLVKWIYLYSDNRPGTLNARPAHVEQTVELLRKYQNQKSPFNVREKGVKQSLRIVGYQQFRFQDQLNNYIVERNFAFFKTIGEWYGVDAVIKQHSGLTIQQIVFVLNNLWNHYSSFQKGDQSFTGKLDDRQLRFYFYEVEQIQLFKRLFVFEGSNAASIQKIQNESNQLYETRLWSTKPFIRLGNSIQLLHRNVLKETCRYFLYEFLKQNWSEFQEKIGRIMEIYVSHGLKEMRLSYEDETQIKKVSKPNLCCDFVIEGGVLVECKAIDIKPVAAIQRTKKILQNEFESTIVKGYKQLLEIASRRQSSASLYGLIITYRDTFVGFGEDAWKEFLESPINKYLQDHNLSLSALPPERMCVITLDNWDQMVQIVKDGRASLPEILEGTFDLLKAGHVMLMDEALNRLYNSSPCDLSYLKSSGPYEKS